MKISVVCREEVFSRMLELEFGKFGVECEREFPTDDKTDCDFAILDCALLGHFEFAYGFYKNVPSVLYGYPEQLSQLPSEITALFNVYTRPFRISRLLTDVLGSDKPSSLYRADGKILRVKSPADALVIDRERRAVYCRGEEVDLTRREFDLLLYLTDNKGRTVTRDELCSSVWGGTAGSGTNVVDVYVRYLREKIDERFGIKLISAVRGVGYTVKTEFQTGYDSN